MLAALLARKDVKFLLWGAFSNLLGYGYYLALVWVGCSPYMAVLLSFVLCVLQNIHVHQKYVFSATLTHGKKLFYVMLYIGSYVLNNALLWLGYDYGGFPHAWVQLFLTGFLAIAMYIALNTFIFK